MPVKGIDIYHGDSPVDFHAFAARGAQFVIAKSSQGADSSDPLYSQYRKRVATVPLLMFGAYHFFTSDDPIAQAQHFLACASPALGDIVPFLDVETYFAGVGAAALACAREIERQAGYAPGIYSYDSFFTDNLAAHFTDPRYALWIARYGAEPRNRYDIWQDSETGRVPGIPHDLDTDVYPGDLGDFKANFLITG